MRTRVAAGVAGLLLVAVAVLGAVAVREPERYCSSATGTERCWTEVQYAARVRGQIERVGWWNMCASVPGSHLYRVTRIDLSEPSDTQRNRELALRVIAAECRAWPEGDRLDRGAA